MKKKDYVDFEFIKEIAEDTIEDIGMDSFPIDVFKLAELLKIPLIKYSEFCKVFDSSFGDYSLNWCPFSARYCGNF